VLVLGVAACAADERPQATDEVLEVDSGAELTVDGPTSSVVAPPPTRVVVGQEQEQYQSVPDEAILTLATLPESWAEGPLDVDDLIDACGTVETMNPARDGLAGPVKGFHDTAGTTLVQAVFYRDDPSAARGKLVELEESLDRCNGTERRGRRIAVEPVTAGVHEGVGLLGSARLTARIVATGDHDELVGELVAVEHGHYVVGVLVVGGDEATDAALASLVATTTLAALPAG
jgi:hypothetical protein